ncbi:purine-nucleoside phosphorylase [Fusibacter paucivorans]|uniref:Purine nucleoside phosphorylase n=2 Tax=Fusibacter paucivorans TaxID=76009 RepID=A0ABS5PND0_9FIRM|nr:purine-nucleoside phosphorylase [Fusibacter paucivorans]MBS7526689.1 purine-nucleoside phosphorylase [Fusibacter paucivorans]
MAVNLIEAKEFVAQYIDEAPTVGLILGSGLGDLAEEIESPVFIPYNLIPYFPISTVEGHMGRFVYGDFMGKKVIAMQGRFHFYEGYSMRDITFPIRVMKAIGVKHIILTNAAGGVNRKFKPGDLMLITDQINISGHSPLIGRNDPTLGPRFPDCSNLYDHDFNDRVIGLAKALQLELQQGVYFYSTGPQYETPAEIKMAALLGADAVGMSTVPEAIVAAHAGMKVTGISCITNMAAGIQKTALNHHEVVETANRVKTNFSKLVKKMIEITG